MAWSEAKWIVDQLNQKLGTQVYLPELIVQSVDDTTVSVEWNIDNEKLLKHDKDGDVIASFEGVIMRWSTTDYPEKVTDGQDVSGDTNKAYTIQTISTKKKHLIKCAQGSKVYVSLFSVSKSGVISKNKRTAFTYAKSAQKIIITSKMEHSPTNVNVSIQLTYKDSSGEHTDTIKQKIGDRFEWYVPYVASYLIKAELEYIEQPKGNEEPIIWEPLPPITGRAIPSGEVTKTLDFKRFTRKIIVNVPSRAYVTLKNKKYSISNDLPTLQRQFVVHSCYDWVVIVTSNGQEFKQNIDSNMLLEKDVTITPAVTKVYGISRNCSMESPLWSRTDDAKGLTFNYAFTDMKGYSDFDNCFPWSEMETKNMMCRGESFEMVYIPPFYYKRERNNGLETIQICRNERKGFTLHTGSGVWVSKKNLKGTPAFDAGWSHLNIEVSSAIQMLQLVEYATNDLIHLAGSNGKTYRHIDLPQKVSVEDTQVSSEKYQIGGHEIKFNTNFYRKYEGIGSYADANWNVKNVTCDSDYSFVIQPDMHGGSNRTFYASSVDRKNDTSLTESFLNGADWFIHSYSNRPYDSTRKLVFTPPTIAPTLK